MNLKEFEKLGNERNKELEEYLDFSEFAKFLEILNKQLTGVYVYKNNIKHVMSNFLFCTNIKGEVSSKYGLNGVEPLKVDRDTKEDFDKILRVIDHIDESNILIANLKSSTGDEFITYTQFGIGHKHLGTHLEDLASSLKTAMRLSKGEADNKKTYYLALRSVSRLYCQGLFLIHYNLSAIDHWKLFKLIATYCIFLIKQKLVKKDYETFNSEFWDIGKGLKNSFKLIENEFTTKIELSLGDGT